MPNCCVPNCRTGGNVSHHRIPKEIDRMKAWVVRIGRFDLLEKPNPIINNHYVCSRHFSQKQRMAVFVNNRSPLMRTAVPDILLPSSSDPPNNDNTDAEIVRSDHSYPYMYLSHEVKVTPKKPEPLEDFLKIKCIRKCLFCRKVLEKTNEVNIQMNVTDGGKIVENFLRELLHIDFDVLLESYFICSDCLELINEYEKHFSKCITIQDSLKMQYLDHHKKKRERTDSNFENNTLNANNEGLPPLVISDSKEFATIGIQTSNDRIQDDDNFYWDYPDEHLTAIENFPNSTENIPELQKVHKKTEFPILKPMNEEKFYIGDELITNPSMIRRLKKEKVKENEERILKAFRALPLTSIPIRKNHCRMAPKPPPEPKCFCCEKCGKVMWGYSAFKKHEMRFHSDENRFNCDICFKDFRSKVTRDNHLMIHSGLRPHKCEKCEKDFIYPKRLADHIMMMHPSEGTSFSCSKCKLKFPNLYRLHKHERRHTNENRYQCETCGKTFTNARSMKLHNMIHLNIRPYKCDICGKAFIFERIYQGHMNRHYGILNFKCDICGKAFATNLHLKYHKRTHSTERPFSCLVCGRRFLRSCAMKKHMKTHERSKNK